MLVCPQCRGENAEEARFCNRCGRALEPTQMALVSRPDRVTALDELDIPPPTRRSPLPGIVTLVVLALAAGGVTTWIALRPNPCQGKFTSAHHPYCVEVPRGWEPGAQTSEGEEVDTFASRAGGAVIEVRVQDVAPGTETGSYAQLYRNGQQQLNPTPLERLRVAGDSAVAWEVSGESGEGEQLRQRQIVLVRGGLGWRILLTSEDTDFVTARVELEDMLDSWSWK